MTSLTPPKFARGAYVKILSGPHAKRYGWVEQLWYHKGQWFIAVNCRVDLTGKYLWFLPDDILGAREADESIVVSSQFRRKTTKTTT